MNFKKIVKFTPFILIIMVLIKILSQDIWEKNESLLKEEVLAIQENVKTINLLDITPFEWDLIYSFSPYTSKEEIYKTVGYKWAGVKTTVSEGMGQIIFMKDSKVVCYLYGYPANNGYGFWFESEEHTESASIIRSDGYLEFKVIRKDGVVYLEQIKKY